MQLNCQVNMCLSDVGCIVRFSDGKEQTMPLSLFEGYAAPWVVHTCEWPANSDRKALPRIVAVSETACPSKILGRDAVCDILRQHARYLYQEYSEDDLRSGEKLMPRGIAWREDIETIYNEKIRAVVLRMMSGCFSAKPAPIRTSTPVETMRTLARLGVPMNSRLTLYPASETTVEWAQQMLPQRARPAVEDATRYTQWRAVVVFREQDALLVDAETVILQINK